MAWFSPPLEEPTRKISFSCPKLDVNFGQCLRIGNVIEISGEAGSAKTQLCLDLTLQTLIVSMKLSKTNLLAFKKSGQINFLLLFSRKTQAMFCISSPNELFQLKE